MLISRLLTPTRSGPIACLIDADDEFDHHYHGGIMMPRKWKGTNHVISVSGWGSEVVNGTEVPYWIVRNSYGSWWGEQGWCVALLCCSISPHLMCPLHQVPNSAWCGLPRYRIVLRLGRTCSERYVLEAMNTCIFADEQQSTPLHPPDC